MQWRAAYVQYVRQSCFITGRNNDAVYYLHVHVLANIHVYWKRVCTTMIFFFFLLDAVSYLTCRHESRTYLMWRRAIVFCFLFVFFFLICRSVVCTAHVLCTGFVCHSFQLGCGVRLSAGHSIKALNGINPLTNM